jgi:predicted N-acyltransferase
MSIILSLIDPVENKEWDSYITAHEHGSLYHHSLWATLIKSSYGYEPAYLILKKGDGGIVGAFASFIVRSRFTGKRIVSLPFADSCDFLANTPQDVPTLQNGVSDLSKKLGISHIEIKAKRNIDFLESTSYSTKQVYKTHTLHLNGDLKSTRKEFHRKTIYDIDKALKSGLKIYVGNNEKDMRSFYKLYTFTRKFHGLIPQPYIFFKNIWRLYHPDNKVDVVFAMDDGRPVAGILLVKFKDTVYYQYAGMMREDAQKRPSYLLLWNAIERSMQEGFTFIDFGRTHPDNQGLLTFKRRWGTIEQDIWSFSYGSNSGNRFLVNRNQLSAAAHSICKIMPDFIIQLAGKLIYKHLG